MGPFDNSMGAVTFWTFVAVVSVVGTLLPYFKHRETQRTIRAAIEKGQPIDPALLAEPPKEKTSKPQEYILGGLVLIASGLGLQVLAVCIGIQAGQTTIWPINGAGAICLLIGIVLFGFGRWVLKSEQGRG